MATTTVHPTRKPKQKKGKKHPKRPKVTASVAVWQKYHNKCAEIDRQNIELEKTYNKELKAYNDGVALKKKLVAQTPGLAGMKKSRR